MSNLTKFFSFLGIKALLLSSIILANTPLQSELDHKAFVEKIATYETEGNYFKALLLSRLLPPSPAISKLTAQLELEVLHRGFSERLFDTSFQPRPKLIHLLRLVGREDSSMTLLDINNWAQKHLLRKGERWEEQSERFESLKDTLILLLEELGFVESAHPSFQYYQGALVHGGLLSRTRLRMHYLIEQWKQGIRFSHLYLLSGARPLDPQHESTKAMMNTGTSAFQIRKGWIEPLTPPATEAEMMQLVWDQCEMPEEMRQQVILHVVNAPMKKDLKSENLVRPTTDDTIEEWVTKNPPPGRYLAVTNAPYIIRQDLITRSLAPSQYGFDTIGPAANPQEKISIFLDELARTIYFTQKCRDEKRKN